MRLPVQPNRFAAFAVIEAVSVQPAGNQCHNASVIGTGSQHGTGSIVIPAGIKTDITSHYAVWPEQEFQNLIHVPDAVRYLLRFDMVEFQNLTDGVRSDLAVVIQGFAHTPPHDSTRHLLEGIFEYRLIRIFPRADLFIKPSHAIPSFTPM